MNTVKYVNSTPNAEANMGYIARVSNPSNQNNSDVAGLLKYCIRHQHWSVFEQSYMTLEIETTRAIAAQILRHRSFTFQEFAYFELTIRRKEGYDNQINYTRFNILEDFGRVPLVASNEAVSHVMDLSIKPCVELRGQYKSIKNVSF